MLLQHKFQLGKVCMVDFEEMNGVHTMIGFARKGNEIKKIGPCDPKIFPF